MRLHLVPVQASSTRHFPFPKHPTRHFDLTLSSLLLRCTCCPACRSRHRRPLPPGRLCPSAGREVSPCQPGPPSLSSARQLISVQLVEVLRLHLIPPFIPGQHRPPGTAGESRKDFFLWWAISCRRRCPGSGHGPWCAQGPKVQRRVPKPAFLRRAACSDDLRTAPQSKNRPYY